MGIRFYCPNGHRLHVKDFLAGKTGICPHCEARFRIPFDSELAPGAPKIKPGSLAETLQRAGERTDAALTIATAPELPVEPLRTSRAASPVSVSAAPSLPHDSSPLNLEEFNFLSASPTAHDSAPASAAHNRVTPNAAVPQTPAAKGLTQSGTQRSAAAPMNREPAGLHARELPDPLAEAPEAVWYVRPPSGGQYGPARGEVMRQWIDEGRVSADSLVWREGWADWRLAGPVFPNLENGYTGLGASAARRETTSPALAVPTIAPTTTSAAAGVRRQRASRNKPVAVVVLLSLLVVALLVGLVIVLSLNPS